MNSNTRNQAHEIEQRVEIWAAAQMEARLSENTLREIRQKLEPSLVPCKPIGSQGRLIATFMAVLAAFAAVLIAIQGKAGLHLMRWQQSAGIVAVLVLNGTLFSGLVAQEMVPGSRRRMGAPIALALSGTATIGVIAALFPWRMTANFTGDGWPCAVLETAIAVPAGGLFWMAARRGALFGGGRAGAAIAALASLLALIAIQFQCMSPQAPHLLFWHAGVAGILIGLGGLIGKNTGKRTGAAA